MKFFTPELFRQFNSPDDDEADLADERWEDATREYHTYIAQHLPTMNDRVRELAQRIALHDAELLAVREVSLSTPGPSPSPSVALLSLQSGENVTCLTYFLASPIEQTTAPDDWPFSMQRTHWLYDEVEVDPSVDRQARFRHNILLSDGRILAIPFLDVVVESFSLHRPEAAVVRKPA